MREIASISYSPQTNYRAQTLNIIALVDTDSHAIGGALFDRDRYDTQFGWQVASLFMLI